MNLKSYEDLRGLMQRLLETQQPQSLTDEQVRQFHTDFRRDVAALIDQHREEQRRAYRESGDVTLN